MTHQNHLHHLPRIAHHEGFAHCWLEPCQRWGRGETPDLFGIADRRGDPGWCSHWTGEVFQVWPGHTLVLELKVSREDFKADCEKPWRSRGVMALGAWRAYVCPEGLIEAHEVEDDCGWGLYWLLEGGSFERVKSPQQFRGGRDTAAELLMLARLASQTHQTKQREKARGAGKLTAKERAEIRAMLEKHGALECLEAARLIASRSKRPGTLARHIADDARAGLIQGVVGEGAPTVLSLAGEGVER